MKTASGGDVARPAVSPTSSGLDDACERAQVRRVIECVSNEYQSQRSRGVARR